MVTMTPSTYVEGNVGLLGRPFTGNQTLRHKVKTHNTISIIWVQDDDSDAWAGAGDRPSGGIHKPNMKKFVIFRYRIVDYSDVYIRIPLPVSKLYFTDRTLQCQITIKILHNDMTLSQWLGQHKVQQKVPSYYMAHLLSCPCNSINIT